MKKRVFIIIGVIIIVLLCVVSYLFFFTEVFGKKLLPVSINNISIKYIPSNNLDYNERYVNEVNIKLEKADFQKVKSLIKKVKKSDLKDKNSSGKYKVVINNDCELIIGEDSSYVMRDKKRDIVTISDELYTEIENIVRKNNDKIFTKVNFKEVIIKKDSASITVKNKYNLELYKDCMSFLNVKLTDEEISKIGEYKMELIVDTNMHVYIYDNNISKIFNKEKNETFFAVSNERLYTISDSIYVSSTKNKE